MSALIKVSGSFLVQLVQSKNDPSFMIVSFTLRTSFSVCEVNSKCRVVYCSFLILLRLINSYLKLTGALLVEIIDGRSFLALPYWPYVARK